MVDVLTGNMYYYGNDQLGTPQIMTDSTNTVVWEADYKPFGEAEVNPNSSVVNNFRFPGQYYDQETGLHYNYHRYYDPSTGRYLTPDPIGQDGGVNLFTYVENNPINDYDPLGLAGIALDLGGAYATGLGGEVYSNTQGRSTGAGVYVGAKKNGYAEIGSFGYAGTMTNSGKTPGAALGAGANITVYFVDAEKYFPGKSNYTTYVIGPFAFTFTEDCETNKLTGVTGSLIGKGFGWFIHSKGYSYGSQGALQ
jgi:RHS repeat-associated protein